MATQRLVVYVMNECVGCDRARRLASELASRMVDVQVEVIDLGEPGMSAPRDVFSVPTWLLNGRVISLGNPDLDELLTRLDNGRRLS